MMGYPPIFNLHGIESIAAKMEGVMRKGLTPSREKMKERTYRIENAVNGAGTSQEPCRAEREKEMPSRS
jgi:hypothetical protein